MSVYNCINDMIFYIMCYLLLLLKIFASNSKVFTFISSFLQLYYVLALLGSIRSGWATHDPLARIRPAKGIVFSHE